MNSEPAKRRLGTHLHLDFNVARYSALIQDEVQPLLNARAEILRYSVRSIRGEREFAAQLHQYRDGRTQSITHGFTLKDKVFRRQSFGVSRDEARWRTGPSLVEIRSQLNV